MHFARGQRVAVTAATLLVSVAIYAPLLARGRRGWLALTTRAVGWLCGISVALFALALAYSRAVAWVTRLSQGAVLLVVAFVFWRAVRARERLLQAVVAVPVLFVSWGATAIVWQDWESTDEEVERCVSDQASTGHLLTAPISCTIEGILRLVHDVTSSTVVQGAALAPVVLYVVAALATRGRADGERAPKVIESVR